jgi:hypothetical protein
MPDDRREIQKKFKTIRLPRKRSRVSFLYHTRIILRKREVTNLVQAPNPLFCIEGPAVTKFAGAWDLRKSISVPRPANWPLRAKETLVRRSSYIIATVMRVLLPLLLLLSEPAAKAQACGNKICGPYSAAMYACSSGTSSGTGCLNTSNVGFYTTKPATGSFDKSFEGIASCAVTNSECEKNAPYDVDPNGGVGRLQFLQSLNTVVQAWDKTTGKGIFANTKNGKAAPQPTGGPFASKLNSHCGSPGGDILAMYDHLDARFLIAFKGRWTGPGNLNHYSWCMAVSTQDDLYNGGVSYWSAYDFVLDTVLPTDSNNANNYYVPDYPKLGTWNDGNFYVSWDLLSPVNYQIYGSEICSVDRTSMIAGKAANPMNCYAYWPAGQTNGRWNPGTVFSLVHTILPADIESAGAQPPAGSSPPFLAIVSPDSGNGAPCRTAPCTSNKLALWRWTSFSAGQAPAYVPVETYTPGCYDPNVTYNTVCINEPGGYRVDSVGDRLMHRLIYRNFGSGSQPSGEILAAAHTIQDPTTKHGDIRYYWLQLTGENSASVLGQGNLHSSNLSLFMPSMAFDKKGNLGVIYSISGGCAESTCYPALSFSKIPYLKPANAPLLIQQGKAEVQTNAGLWGDYFGAGIDPTDDMTFWGTGEYFDQNETSSRTTWQTRVVKMPLD